MGRKIINQWGSDTCGCVIEFEWEEGTTEDARIHTITRVIKACQYHRDPTTHAIGGRHHEHPAWADNIRKNQALGHILEHLPAEHTKTVEDAEGNPTVTFKRNPKWHFDENRTVHFDLQIPDPAIKEHIKNKLVEKFGDKVNIV